MHLFASRDFNRHFERSNNIPSFEKVFSQNILCQHAYLLLKTLANFIAVSLLSHIRLCIHRTKKQGEWLGTYL